MSLFGSLYLRRKSQPSQIKVVESSDEVKSKPEAASTMAVGFFENAENFELANDVLDWNALTSELAVMGDLCLT